MNMTLAMLEALGGRHQSPRGPGKRWWRSAVRTGEPATRHEDDSDDVDFEEAIASW